MIQSRKLYVLTSILIKYRLTVELLNHFLTAPYNKQAKMRAKKEGTTQLHLPKTYFAEKKGTGR